MEFGTRLSIAVLLLGIASFAIAQEVVVINQGKSVDAEALSDIQERLLNLERILVKQYVALDAQLKSLQAELAELSSTGQRDGAVRDIISAINRGHFRFAGDKLVQLGDVALISDIVHEVYSGSECNFRLLVNFTQGLSEITPSYQILSTLYEEMKKYGHMDVKNLITLAKAFENEILQQVNNPGNVKLAVDAILEEILEAITAEASKFLIAAMESERNYAYNEGVIAISAALADYEPGVASAVMQRTVEGAFKTVDHEKILEAVNSHADLWQNLVGIDALFGQIRAAEPYQSSLVVGIASRLSEILNQTEVPTPTMRVTAEALADSLPANAKNLFFLPYFCIYNEMKDSYLQAASTLYDKDRRYVFTVPRPENGIVPTGAKWRVKVNRMKLYFDSIDYPGENIYAAVYNYTKKVHYVFAWLPGNNTDPQSTWTAELDGQKFFLRDEHFGEYLYASNERNHVAGNDYVFTLKSSDAETERAITWQIIDC